MHLKTLILPIIILTLSRNASAQDKPLTLYKDAKEAINRRISQGERPEKLNRPLISLKPDDRKLNKAYTTPLLTLCIQEQFNDLVETLLDHKVGPNTDFALHTACSHNNLKACKLLLAHDASVSKKNYNSDTALHVITNYPKANTIQVALITELLKHSANPNELVYMHMTPLLQLVTSERTEEEKIALAKPLINFGADISIAAPDFGIYAKKTPLEIAYKNGETKLAKVLKSSTRKK